MLPVIIYFRSRIGSRDNKVPGRHGYLVDDDLNEDRINDIYSQLERHADGDYLRMAI